MRTPEQKIAGLMDYLKHIKPQREQFEKVTCYELDLLMARLDELL